MATGSPIPRPPAGRVTASRRLRGLAVAVLALAALGVALAALAQAGSHDRRHLPGSTVHHPREVFGTPLSRARHVVVLVHGVNNDARTYRARGGLREAAGNLLASLPPGSAVVTFNYEAPRLSYRGLTDLALSMSTLGSAWHARRAAPELVAAVRTIRAHAPGAQLDLACHSYGVTVCGQAAVLGRQLDSAAGLPIDNLFAFGGPGMGVPSSSALGLPRGARVFAAEDPRDPIPSVPLLGPSPASRAFDDDGRVTVLASRSDALTPFGAHAFAGSYLRAGGDGVRSIVAVARGREPERATLSPRPGSLLTIPGMAGLGASAAERALSSAPGGIDFETVELRYLTDAGALDRRAAAYAFSARRAARGRRRGSPRALREASDAFFVWLALPRWKFTVNLNPNEPDRIVDPDLGRTHAGRVLLEADLRMKRTVARLIHPGTARGARFWRALERIQGTGGVCASFRQWIVPAPAIVRSTGRELLILRAPLDVRTEAQYLRVKYPGGQPGRACPRQAPGQERRGEAVYRRLVLPGVERAVNRAPEYAALRRVHASRVAAEWYRALSARRSVAFDEVIDRGDVRRWAARGRWRPRDVFRRYLRSLREGEFRVTRETRSGRLVVRRMYVFGGVDLTSVRRRTVSAAAVRRLRPRLPARLVRALSSPAPDRRRREVWLAGASFDRASARIAPAMPDPRLPATRGYDGDLTAQSLAGPPPRGGGPGIAVAGAAALALLLGLLGRRETRSAPAAPRPGGAMAAAPQPQGGGRSRSGTAP